MCKPEMTPVKMNIDVQNKFDLYPEQARNGLLQIRTSIFEVAKEDETGKITETLKWGEPSYLTKQGSTVRLGWKSKKPDNISVYFNCKTTLIKTFKEIYGGTFKFVDNREISFPLSGKIPIKELKACISMALRYHNIKHLPLLGA